MACKGEEKGSTHVHAMQASVAEKKKQTNKGTTFKDERYLVLEALVSGCKDDGSIRLVACEG